MPLVYSGIDEAGYGPMLGPLCVARATLTVDEGASWKPGGVVPNIWELLGGVVCRTKREAKGLAGGFGIPVADSKALKLSNSVKTMHPCHYLERGVLAFLGADGSGAGIPRTDLELFDRLGVSVRGHRCYGGRVSEADAGGEPIELPMSGAFDELRIAANELARAMQTAGVGLGEVVCRWVSEVEFNEVLRAHGSKGATTSMALAEHLAGVREAYHQRWKGGVLRIVADRQSGRQDYRGPIGRAWPGVGVDVVEQSAERSRYRAAGGDCELMLMSEAEDQHLPVALASMAAKYVRELAMARFNRYWGERVAELKPTAGYVQDARRWLHEVGDVFAASDREQLVRRA